MPALDRITTDQLKAKRDILTAQIAGINRDRDLLLERKAKLTAARDKISGILNGTITGDEAIAALAEALDTIERS